MSEKWKRRELLLDFITGKGNISVENLSSKLGISTSTIRRDLDALEKEEIVVRTHGGVTIHHGFTTLLRHFDERKTFQMTEKKLIAEKIFEQLSDNISLILDSGTTAYYVAKLLVKRKNIRVATNSLKVAAAISASEKNTVFLSGGEFRPRNYDLIGEETVAYFNNIMFDYAVISSESIVLDNGFYRKCCTCAAVNRAMVRSAKTVFVVADSSKLVGSGNFKSADVEEVSKLFIDSGIDEQMLLKLSAQNFETVLC